MVIQLGIYSGGRGDVLAAVVWPHRYSHGRPLRLYVKVKVRSINVDSHPAGHDSAAVVLGLVFLAIKSLFNPINVMYALVVGGLLLIAPVPEAERTARGWMI